jgi:hypothetical protein
MNAWFAGIDGDTSTENALVALKKSLNQWNRDMSKNNISKSMAPVGDKVTPGIFKSIAKIVKSHPMGSYNQKKAIDSEIKKINFK